MPKKRFPCFLALVTMRSKSSKLIFFWGAATSTQHPRQRRLQELMIEM